MGEEAVYVVIRRDLKMRRGKEIAQGVHAVARLGYVEGAPLVVVQAADGIRPVGTADRGQPGGRSTCGHARRRADGGSPWHHDRRRNRPRREGAASEAVSGRAVLMPLPAPPETR